MTGVTEPHDGSHDTWEWVVFWGTDDPTTAVWDPNRPHDAVLTAGVILMDSEEQARKFAGANPTRNRLARRPVHRGPWEEMYP